MEPRESLRDAIVEPLSHQIAAQDRAEPKASSLGWSGPLAAMTALLVAVLFWSTVRLDAVPPHLHHDEVLVGLLGWSIADSGRDLNGRLFPIYFQVPDTINWYPPIVVYATAASLVVLPLSDIAVRLPNALLGTLCVWLMFLAARKLFRADWAGVAAAALLATTPAFLMHSRILTDSLYPVGFILLWLLLLEHTLERPTPARLVLTTSVLGIGLFSYIGSVIMMPVYFVMTLVVLCFEERAPTKWAWAAAGFGWPIAIGVVFLFFHPEMMDHATEKYHLRSGGAGLNLFQQLRDTLTIYRISDWLNLYQRAFDPGYLFVTGGANPAHSTRQAGVLLAPMFVLITIGLVTAIRWPTRQRTLATIGFLTAPLAATFVNESYAITRMLCLLPFAALLGVDGLRRVMSTPLHRPQAVRTIGIALGFGISTLGIVYFAVIIASRGVSGSALALVVAGSGIAWLGWACARSRQWRPVATALVLMLSAQFAIFCKDYFGDYAARSAARYGNNLRGGIEQLIAMHDRHPDDGMYLNNEIPFVRAYWDFYARVLHRHDLLGRAMPFDSGNVGDLRGGSLLLTDVSDKAKAAIAARPDIVELTSAFDVNGRDSGLDGAAHQTFVVYRKR